MRAFIGSYASVSQLPHTNANSSNKFDFFIILRVMCMRVYPVRCVCVCCCLCIQCNVHASDLLVIYAQTICSHENCGKYFISMYQSDVGNHFEDFLCRSRKRYFNAKENVKRLNRWLLQSLLRQIATVKIVQNNHNIHLSHHWKVTRQLSHKFAWRRRQPWRQRPIHLVLLISQISDQNANYLKTNAFARSTN